MVQLPYPTAPFKKIKNPGESVTIDTAGKVVIIPTENSSYLPSWNEDTLNSNRLTIAESPFGGLKGSGAPDYAPGTVYVNSGDGVYLTDINGQNSSKTLTAGKLKELGLLTVDTAAKTITEEFILENTSTSNNPAVIDSFTVAAPWAIPTSEGSGTISAIGNKLIVEGQSGSTGVHRVRRDFTITNATEFIRVKIRNSQNANFSMVVYSDAGFTVYKYWSSSRFPMLANTDYIFVLPLKAPAGASTASNPDGITGSYDPAKIYRILIGVIGTVNGSANTITISELQADVGKSAYVEIDTPDNLADSSINLQCWDGTQYQSVWQAKLDNGYSNILANASLLKFLDRTCLTDVYGSGAGSGRTIYPKSVSGGTVAGSSGTMTFSTNKGCKNRIGFMVQLPPSDNGRTNFNKIRLKLVTYYDSVNKALSVLPDISGNGNNGVINGCGIDSNGGLTFNGSSNEVIIPDKDLFSFGNGGTDSPFSVFVRCKINRETSFRAVSKAIDPVGSAEWAFGANSAGNYLLALYSSGSTGVNIFRMSTSSALSDVGNIISIASTYDGSKSGNGIKLYKSGSLLDSSATSDGSYVGMSNTSSDVTIGSVFRLSGGMKSNAYGVIYEVRIYNRVLTSDEISLLHSGQNVLDGLIGFWKPAPVQNMGASSYTFEDSLNASYGLQNMVKPFIALYDPAENYIEFFLFTHRPKNLTIKRDDSGNIYEITLYPGNGSIYRGRTTNTYASVADFLACYGMVI